MDLFLLAQSLDPTKTAEALAKGDNVTWAAYVAVAMALALAAAAYYMIKLVAGVPKLLSDLQIHYQDLIERARAGTEAARQADLNRFQTVLDGKDKEFKAAMEQYRDFVVKMLNDERQDEQGGHR